MIYPEFTNKIIDKLRKGMIPMQLAVVEVVTLIEEFGDDWFEKLGFSEDEFQKPVLSVEPIKPKEITVPGE